MTSAATTAYTAALAASNGGAPAWKVNLTARSTFQLTLPDALNTTVGKVVTTVVADKAPDVATADGALDADRPGRDRRRQPGRGERVERHRGHARSPRPSPTRPRRPPDADRPAGHRDADHGPDDADHGADDAAEHADGHPDRDPTESPTESPTETPSERPASPTSEPATTATTGPASTDAPSADPTTAPAAPTAGDGDSAGQVVRPGPGRAVRLTSPATTSTTARLRSSRRTSPAPPRSRPDVAATAARVTTTRPRRPTRRPRGRTVPAAATAPDRSC